MEAWFWPRVGNKDEDDDNDETEEADDEEEIEVRGSNKPQNIDLFIADK